MLKADLAVLADAANMSAEGKLNLLGEFNMLSTSTPPWTMVGKWLVLRLTGNAGDVGPHTLGLRLMDPDRQLIWSSPDRGFDFAPAKIPGTAARGVLLFGLPPVLMHVEGTHELEGLVDGVVIARVELHCVGAGAPGHAQG